MLKTPLITINPHYYICGSQPFHFRINPLPTEFALVIFGHHGVGDCVHGSTLPGLRSLDHSRSNVYTWCYFRRSKDRHRRAVASNAPAFFGRWDCPGTRQSMGALFGLGCHQAEPLPASQVHRRSVCGVATCRCIQGDGRTGSD